MDTEPSNMPAAPEGSRLLQLGERVEANDLHWDEHESQWRPVLTVHGHTTIKAEQFGWFCRRVAGNGAE